MKLFKNLFGKKENAPQVPVAQFEYPIEVKLQHKVYPRIKNINSQHFDVVYHQPLGGDLTLTFVQDINDELIYIQKSEVEQLRHLIDHWENNIAKVGYTLFTTDEWSGLVYFNEPGDHSNEKIFDVHFINATCEKLNTDKVIFSISRRHRMQMTNYYNEYIAGEKFFWSHFRVWSDSQLPDETITESVLIGEKDKGITYIVNMGFRMNMYEKDGQRLLSYADYDNAISDKIDFAENIEK